MRRSEEEKLKVNLWLKQCVHEGAILSNGESWERNQLEDTTESYFMFISYFFHSDISSLWEASVYFTLPLYSLKFLT